MSGTPILFPFKQGAFGEVFFTVVEMTTATSAAPTGVVDNESIVSTTTAPSYAATGLYTVTLQRRYTKIIAVAAVVEDVLLVAAPYEIVDGSAATNYVKFAIWTKSTGAPVDSNAKVVSLILVLVP